MGFTQDELRIQLSGLCLFANDVIDKLHEEGVHIHQKAAYVHLSKDDYKYVQSTVKTLSRLIRKLASQLKDKELAARHFKGAEALEEMLTFETDKTDFLNWLAQTVNQSSKTSDYGKNN